MVATNNIQTDNSTMNQGISSKWQSSPRSIRESCLQLTTRDDLMCEFQIAKSDVSALIGYQTIFPSSSMLHRSSLSIIERLWPLLDGVHLFHVPYDTIDRGAWPWSSAN